jgi:hypothetical protein
MSFISVVPANLFRDYGEVVLITAARRVFPFSLIGMYCLFIADYGDIENKQFYYV